MKSVATKKAPTSWKSSAGRARSCSGVIDEGIGASWGGFESLVVSSNLSQSRTASPWSEPGPLLRFQIGLEDPRDLNTDLAAAFAAAEFLMDYLKTERIPVVSKDVMDVYPRKVCFLPSSGKAMVKRLAPTNIEALAAQDRAAVQRAQPAVTGGGSVDLF